MREKKDESEWLCLEVTTGVCSTHQLGIGSGEKKLRTLGQKMIAKTLYSIDSLWFQSRRKKNSTLITYLFFLNILRFYSKDVRITFSDRSCVIELFLFLQSPRMDCSLQKQLASKLVNSQNILFLREKFPSWPKVPPTLSQICFCSCITNLGVWHLTTSETIYCIQQSIKSC